MYESPIQVNLLEGYEKFKREMDDMIGDEVYKHVLNLGIQVDKEELEKAMLNDRHQYMKGYTDGCAATEERISGMIEQLQNMLEEIR